ncbi:MAG: alcohol dehydrogenase catalytic domain-containing protein [Microbacteriaceae bacterium]
MEMVYGATAQRAAVLHGPGDIRVEPRAIRSPGLGQALVALRAVGICGSDVSYLRGTSKYPIPTPFVLGHEAAGVVVAVGGPRANDASDAIQVGTRVALIPGASCGRCEQCRRGADNLCKQVRYLGSAASEPPVDGALQDFITFPTEHLLRIPDDVSYATAALLEPLAVAEHAVQRGRVHGLSVLVTGGGAIGQLLALAAEAAGAREVTVCEIQQRRRQLALEHGAEHAVTPGELESKIAEGTRFDVVLDATGSPAAVELSIRAAMGGSGRIIIVGNMPPGHGLPTAMITRTELWVSGTFRFPGGLARALELVVSGVDVAWLVESTAELEQLDAAFAAATQADPPLKVHIVTPATAITGPITSKSTGSFSNQLQSHTQKGA